jgi:hypothetical protein
LEIQAGIKAQHANATSQHLEIKIRRHTLFDDFRLKKALLVLQRLFSVKLLAYENQYQKQDGRQTGAHRNTS